MQGVRQTRSHLLRNQTDSSVYEFDFLAKTNIVQCKFKSGEYGGKYNSLHPTLWINSWIRPPLWNVAWSITITCPVISVGTKLVSNHISKTVRLQEPSMVKESLNFWLHRAFAIVLTRRWRLPDFSAWNRWPQRVPSIIILMQIIQPRFIKIDNLLRRNCRQLGYKSLPLRFIPFFECHRSFFSSKTNFFQALDIVRELIYPSQSKTLSTWVLSPLVKAFSRNLSQSVILWPLPGGSLNNAKKSPVSVNRFNPFADCVATDWLSSSPAEQ